MRIATQVVGCKTRHVEVAALPRRLCWPLCVRSLLRRGRLWRSSTSSVPVTCKVARHFSASSSTAPSRGSHEPYDIAEQPLSTLALSVRDGICVDPPLCRGTSQGIYGSRIIGHVCKSETVGKIGEVDEIGERELVRVVSVRCGKQRDMTCG